MSGQFSHSLSFFKALSYRALATLGTILISYLVTRQVAFAITIGTIEVFAKIALYYFHERAWHVLGRYFRRAS